MAKTIHLLIVVLLLVTWPVSAWADVTPDQLRIAIDKAIKYIKDSQQAGGAAGNNPWADFGRQGGLTALNTLALLNAGVPENDPAVRKGLDYLNNVKNTDTYVVSLKAMVYRYADPKKYQRQLQDCANWLMDAQLPSGTWTYNKLAGNMAANRTGDNSNTQFALLGLHEAANGGIKIRPEVWRRSEAHFVKSQLKDGGWHYQFVQLPANVQGRVNIGSYGSMTCAGIASLYITGNQLDVSQETGYTDGVGGNCGRYRQNDAIAKGLAWMTAHFTVDENPGQGASSWRFYYLYAMERVGMISGQRFFGDRDWYREGVEVLVKSQSGDGSWSARPGMRGVGNVRIAVAAAPWDTAFALLFLAKGNRPALVNKLQWGSKTEWCPDRNDIEHLVRFVNAAQVDGKPFTQQPVGWQTVNTKARIVDLMDAPILYITGHAFPAFTAEEQAKLKELVDQGGTILFEACCSKKEFTDGFFEFARKVWPEYPVTRLPNDDPVFSSFYTIAENEFNVQGIRVGCRTSVFLVAKDVSCLWEQADHPLSRKAFELGTNIAAYATGLERLKDKLAKARVTEAASGAKPGDIVRGALHIGVLSHSKIALENMPDPNAIPKFSEFLRDQAKIDVATKLMVIEPTDPELLNHPIMYMTGHNGFEYSAAQIKAIRTWLDRGGFLLADSCCGRDAAIHNLPGDAKPTNDFGTSFRKMVQAIYPDAKLAELPADHAIRGGGKGFFPLGTVSYRPEIQAKLLAADPAKARTPRIEGVIVDGRLVVVYSPYALTCGLEDHKCFNCRGLVSADAYHLATNAVLYALSN